MSTPHESTFMMDVCTLCGVYCPYYYYVTIIQALRPNDAPAEIISVTDRAARDVPKHIFVSVFSVKSQL